MPNGVNRIGFTRLPDQEKPSTEVPGGTINWILRNYRKQQQALALGPVLGAQRALSEGRVIRPRDILAGSREAVSRDLSFRDVAQRAGLKGKTAWAAGTVGDLVADPLNLVPVGWFVKGGRAALGAARIPQATRAVGRVGQEAIEAVGGGGLLEKAKRGFITDYGKPEGYVETFEKFGRNRSDRMEQAADFGRRLDEFSAPDQRVITDYLESSKTGRARDAILSRASAGTSTVNKSGDNILDLSARVRQADIDIGNQLVTEGFMKPEVMKEMGGSHIQWMYRQIEEDPKLAWKAAQEIGQLSLKPRERTKFLAQRKGAPDLDRIYEAAYPVAKGQRTAGSLLATREFFNEVAKRFAQDLPSEGYKLVRNDNVYGPLKNKYVPDAIYDDIVRASDQGEKGFPKIWKKGVGLWKYGKIVMNPASHARNIVGNFILADMAGLSPWKVHRYVDGLRSLSTKDEFYTLAKKHSDFLTDTFAQTELPGILDSATSLPQLKTGLVQLLQKQGKKGLRSFGKAYQKEEEFFKQSFFIDHMKTALSKQGKSLSTIGDEAKAELAKAAGKAADEALFNYRKLPMAIDRARRFGVVPFIAFPWKAAPATVKAMGNRPEVFTRYGNLMRAFEPDIETQSEERRSVSDWMQSNWMRLPENTPLVRNKYGEPVFLNLEFILPWTEVGEIVDRTAKGELSQGFLGESGPQLSYLNVPAANIVAAVMLGRDTFSGRPIEDYEGGASQYFLDQLLPNIWVDPVTGMRRGAREMAAAKRGEHLDPSRRHLLDEPRSFGSAVAKNIFGLSTQPVNLTRSKWRKMNRIGREIDEVRRETKEAWAMPDDTPSKSLKKERAITKQMNHLKKLMRETFFVSHGRWPEGEELAE